MLHAITDLPDREWQREVNDLIEQAIDVLALGERGFRGEVSGGGGKPSSREPGEPGHMSAQRIALGHLRAAIRVMRQDADRTVERRAAGIEGDRNPRWMTTEEFREVFEASGLTQMEFAARLPISQRMVSYWLSGEKGISEGASCQIRRAFGNGK